MSSIISLNPDSTRLSRPDGESIQRASSLPKLNLTSLKKVNIANFTPYLFYQKKVPAFDPKVKYSKALKALAMRPASFSQLPQQEPQKIPENTLNSEKAEQDNNVESKDLSLERSKEETQLEELYGAKPIDPTLSSTKVEFRCESLKYDRVKVRRQQEYEHIIRNEWKEYEDRRIIKEIGKGQKVLEKDLRSQEDQKVSRKKEIDRKRKQLEEKIDRLQDRVSEKHQIRQMWDRAYAEFQDLKPLHHLREHERQKRLEKQRKKFEDEEQERLEQIKAKFHKSNSKDTVTTSEDATKQITSSDNKSKRGVSSQNVRWKLDGDRPSSSFKAQAGARVNSENPKGKDEASAIRSKTPGAQEATGKSRDNISRGKNADEKILTNNQLTPAMQRSLSSFDGKLDKIKKRDATPKKTRTYGSPRRFVRKSGSPTMESRTKVPVQFPAIYKEKAPNSNRESMIVDSSRVSELPDLQLINSQRELRHKYAQYVKDQFGVRERKTSKSPKSKKTIYQVLNSIYQPGGRPGSKSPQKAGGLQIRDNIWEFAKKDFINKQRKMAMGRSESVGKIREDQENFTLLATDLASHRSIVEKSKRRLNDNIYQKMDSLSETIITYQNEIGFKKYYQIAKKIG